MLRRYYGKISKLPIDEFVGHDGELVVDDVSGRVYVMDGVTYGGIELVGATSKLTPTPPSLPLDGSLWYDPNAGRLYIYYDDAWVDACPTIKGDKGDPGPGSVYMGGNLIPNANVTYTIGNSSVWWKELWVSSNTVYLGGIPLSVNASGILTVNGQAVGGSYGNSNVASYLLANPITTSNYNDSNVAAYIAGNPPAGTYTNSNVAAYLTNNPQPGTYTNTNVAAYLASNPPAGTYTNSNVAAYLDSNPQPGTYTNTNVAAYLASNPQPGTYGDSNVSLLLSQPITLDKVSISNTDNSISTSTGSLTLAGGLGVSSDVHIGGTVKITDATPSTSYDTGALIIDGGLGVNGNINLSGNINITNGNINIVEFTGATGNFYGDIVTGFGAMYAGKSGFTALPYTVAQISTNSDSYSQINMQNINSGELASVDFVGTADIGTDSSWFFDLGVAGSGYDPVVAAQNNALGTSIGPLDTYLYVQGNVSVPNSGGNLTIGTSQTNKVVKFIAGGVNAENVVLTLAQDKITATQPIVSTNFVFANTSSVVDVINSAWQANAATQATQIAAKTNYSNSNVASYLVANPQGSTYSNSNVASYLTGTMHIGNINLGTAVRFNGTTQTIDTTNGSAITIGSRLNLTGIGVGLGLTVTNPATFYSGVTVANLVTTNGVYWNNGQPYSSGTTYSNSNVAAYLPTYSGNVNAAYFTGNGSSLTGLTYSSASNIVGPGTNVNLVAGSFTYTFDNGGTLTLPAAGGNEGAEIDFIKAPNSSLSGTAVIVDQYIDRIRIFENGGTNRGVYVDLTQAGAGVGTLLNNRVSGLVNAGTFVTMDLIKATVTTSGNRGLSLATTTGTLTYNIGGTWALSNSTSGGASLNAQSLTTSATTSIFGWSFGSAGDMQTYILTDTTNSRCYRITLMIGTSYNNNMICIERLV